MASKKRVTQSAEEMAATKAMLEEMLKSAPQRPKGLTNRSDDVVGFWPPEGAGGIYCTPLFYKLFDGPIDAIKPAALIFARLEAPRKLIVKGGGVVDGEAGQLVAFWFRAGMKSIKMCANVKTFVEDTGELIDTGKGNPMKGYLVESEDGGAALPLSEDKRDKSKSNKHILQG